MISKFHSLLHACKLLCIQAFVTLYYLVKRTLGVNMRGLGYALACLDRDALINIDGRQLFFNHKIARAYGLLVIGKSNEPETLLFLKSVLHQLDQSSRQAVFVDVGASVGEFVFAMAGDARVSQVVAMEPLAEAAHAIRKTAELNHFAHKVRVIEKICNANGETEVFVYDQKRPTASHQKQQGENGAGLQALRLHCEAITLDAELKHVGDSMTIILIDVEGAELRVLSGGRDFIAKNKPLIIFEYNQVSKKHFSLDQAQSLLSGYELFRLRKDGRLDKDFTATWNLVAVPAQGPFREAVKNLLVVASRG